MTVKEEKELSQYIGKKLATEEIRNIFKGYVVATKREGKLYEVVEFIEIGAKNYAVWRYHMQKELPLSNEIVLIRSM